MSKLYDIFENESPDKAYLIYVLVALKMVKKEYATLPEKLQHMVDDARTYWTDNNDFTITPKQMDAYASYVSKLRASKPEMHKMHKDLNLKVMELALNPSINYDYFDYHVDWMYEVGNKAGFSNQKLDQLIDETIDEFKN